MPPKPSPKPRVAPKINRPKPVSQRAPKTAAPPTKKFGVEPWVAAEEGAKVIGYGTTGIGKTTLFSMMPDAIFIGLDDGGRRIVNPVTGKPIRHVPGVETYADVRAALQQSDLFPKGSSCVIDTLTLVERVAEQHVLDTVPLPKNGGKANNIKHYGWNEGSSHVLDAMRIILQDFDALIRRGVNVGLICQTRAITVANAEGTDYLQECPRLHHDNKISVMDEVCAWADHIFRVSFLSTTVTKGKDQKIGRITSGDSTRVISIQGAPYFKAKSRTLEQFVDADGEPVESISFEGPADNSIWQFIFPEETP